jgi:hypothetical protein
MKTLIYDLLVSILTACFTLLGAFAWKGSKMQLVSTMKRPGLIFSFENLVEETLILGSC